MGFLKPFLASVAILPAMILGGAARVQAQEETPQAEVTAEGEGSAWAKGVLEIDAMIAAGELDAALEEALRLEKITLDKSRKSEVLRLIADCYRKKGDWREARSAYKRLQASLPESSDGRIIYGAIAEILRLSPQGVYLAAVKAMDPENENPPTLADDEAMNAALRYRASLLAEKVVKDAAGFRRARTPQALIETLRGLVNTFREARVQWPQRGYSEEHEISRMAGDRLQELCDKIVQQFEMKIIKVRQKRGQPWTYTNVEKEEIGKNNMLAKKYADLESEFQSLMNDITGPEAWPVGDEIGRLSADRASTFNRIADEFVIPPDTRIRLR